MNASSEIISPHCVLLASVVSGYGESRYHIKSNAIFNAFKVRTKKFGDIYLALHLVERISFSNFSCRFLIPNDCFQFEFKLFWCTIRSEEPPGKSKNAFCFKKCLDLLLFDQIDLVISKKSQSSAFNFKSFSRSLEHFFLTEGQNNFWNKIPFRASTSKVGHLCYRGKMSYWAPYHNWD